MMSLDLCWEKICEECFKHQIKAVLQAKGDPRPQGARCTLSGLCAYALWLLPKSQLVFELL